MHCEGEPNDHGSGEDCGYVKNGNGLWNDLTCIPKWYGGQKSIVCVKVNSGTYGIFHTMYKKGV